MLRSLNTTPQHQINNWHQSLKINNSWRAVHRYKIDANRPSLTQALPSNYPSVTTTKTLICPGWETAVVPVSQPGTPVRDKRGCPFVPGVATGTKEDLLSRLVTPTGTKGAASAHVAGAPFCPGWCYQPGQKVSFFFMFFFSQFFFYFNYTFAFQLNLCIGIQCVWSPLIYTYIYSYLYNIFPR